MMKSPFYFEADKPVKVIGEIFGTPLAVQGLNWLPLNQIIFLAIFTFHSTKKHSAWPAWHHLLLGGSKMVVFLGSEWCHNLMHAAAARAVGKPVDAMRIVVGMPVLIYNEPEHPSITPREHILRSLGGPACSAVLLIISKLFQHITPSGSAAREVADVAAGMNTFITAASLTPIPVFDGGPILKWSLISRGLSPVKAEQAVTRANQIAGAGLLGATMITARKRRWFLAVIFSLLGVLSILAGAGKFKD